MSVLTGSQKYVQFPNFQHFLVPNISLPITQCYYVYKNHFVNKIKQQLVADGHSSHVLKIVATIAVILTLYT